ncbi:MAG: 5-formyltetrahydrofolate cyclo-ligase [Nitrospinaceae bacterium]
MNYQVRFPSGRLKSLEAAKASIREEMAKRRNSLKASTLKEKSEQILKNLAGHEEFQNARSILFYLSLPREVQTDAMIALAFQWGKKVHVPLIDTSRRGLRISELPAPDIEFEKRAFGLREPGKPDQKIVSPAVLDFILVPGLAFDRKGGRIGYGAGYYDRFLKEVSQDTILVAAAFDFQVLESVPQAEYDVPVHKILTENTTINC